MMLVPSALALAIATIVATVVITTTIPLFSSVFAYNKYGFESEEQKSISQTLNIKEVFFDNATYTKLIDMCEHKSAANATKSPTGKLLVLK